MDYKEINKCFAILLTVHLGTIIVNNQIDALFQYIYLFPFSTCFEEPNVIIRTIELYQYIIWYVSLCVGDGMNTRQSPTQSDIHYTR